MKKSQFKLNLIALAFSALIPLSSFAMDTQNGSNPSGYLTDSSGQVVRSGTGLCWKTSADAVPGVNCDGDSEKQAEVSPAVNPTAQDDVVASPTDNAVVKTISEVILFDFDSSDLKFEEIEKLNNIILSLGKDMNMYTLHVTGHADPVGTNKYNQKLSERRTNTVADYLISKGVEANTLDEASKGESEPVVSCVKKHPNVCNQPNRRVEITSTTN